MGQPSRLDRAGPLRVEQKAHSAASGFSGDRGPSADARLDTPTDVAVDRARNVFIADLGNRRVRKVTP